MHQLVEIRLVWDGPEAFISNMLPSDADAGGLGAIVRNHWFKIKYS